MDSETPEAVSPPELVSMSQAAAGLLSRLRDRKAEHERRMREEPAYRAAQEVEAAEKFLREWDEALEDDRSRTMRRKASAERTRIDRRIPRRLWVHLDAPKDTAALSAVRGFMRPEDKRTFLVLAGGVGTGKTVAACWGLTVPFSVSRVRPSGYLGDDQYDTVAAGGLFVCAMELVRAGTFNEEFWDGAQGASRLVIDDLGTEPQDEKGWSYANLCDLLNYRYDWERKTVITTNLGMEAFKARYLALDGGRLLDRLKEAGTFFEVSGESMRKATP